MRSANEFPDRYFPRISKNVTYRKVPVAKAVNTAVAASLKRSNLELSIIQPKVIPVGDAIAKHS